MRPFAYQNASTAAEALAAQRSANDPRPTAAVGYLAGGTTMLDLMKLDVMQPGKLVDINALGGTSPGGRITADASGLRMGALVRMADAARDPSILRDYPVIAQTLSLAASSGLRNMASLSGNMLQRTRCSYFRDTSYAQCNKRQPGSGCAALDGINRGHAVLGVSDQCIASYPGDFAQALMALDAVIEIQGKSGPRAMPFAALHVEPGHDPSVETTLGPGDLITAIHVPASADTRRSLYVKVRDRASYAFALASTAVVLDLDGDRVKRARIALGGVATTPWRASEAEDLLKGQVLDEAVAAKAAKVAFAGAKTREHNAYKVPLGEATMVRALLEAARLEI